MPMKTKYLAHQFIRMIRRSARILVAGTMLTLLAAATLQGLHPIVARAATSFVFFGLDPLEPSHSKWTDPNNWSPPGVPGRFDDVIIVPHPPLTPFTQLVTGIPAGAVVHGLTLEPGATLGGTLFGEPVGDLTVTATFNWTGGRLVVPLTVPVGGAVSISGADAHLTTAGLSGTGVLNLAGTTTLSGVLNFGGFDGPAFINNTGTFTTQPGASMTGLACCQNPSQFQNAGTLVNDSGSSTTPINFMELANTGTIQLTSGVLRVNFPTALPSSNTSFTQPNGALVQIIIGGIRPGIDFGQLQVSASATLGGTLIATNATGFTPTPGQTFRVITCGVACNGTFTNVRGNYSAQYHPQDVTLIAGSSPPDSDLGLTNMPTNITTNATSPQGAVVHYTPPTATDESGDSSTALVTCTPTSGSTFAIGTTIVTCTATDSDDTNSPVSQSFTVTVNDTDLGLTNLPTNLTVNATSPQGATVTYTPPTVVDEDSPLPPVNCTPASGSTFAIGTSTVTCTVSDSDDTPSSVSQSFTVTVNGAATQVSALISLVNSFHLSPQGIQTSFDSQLQAVQADLANNNTAQACSDLTSFINHVQAQSGKHLTVSQANQLIAAATNIKKVLGC
jgi:hypothetical protein